MRHMTLKKYIMLKMNLVYNLNFPNKSIKPDVKTVLAFDNNNIQILPTHGLVSVKKEIFNELKFNHRI